MVQARQAGAVPAYTDSPTMNTAVASFRSAASARIVLLCLVAAVGGAALALAYSQREKAALQAQLAGERELARQAAATTPDPKEVERLRAQVREAADFKKDAEEVHRLRGEVTQLRQDKAMLEKTVGDVALLRQQAQSAQRLQAELTALRAQHVADLQVLQQAQVAAGVIAAAPVQVQNSCIANLKQIDGATQQWALENRKMARDPVDWKGIQAYLKGGVLPVCPGGGVYQPGVNVNAAPTCSVPGHKL